jgi:hypothetical protein
MILIEVIEDKNENNDPNVKAKPRGKVKLEYVKDSKIRSNRKKKRKVSLLKNINEFDVMFGANSLLISETEGCEVSQ